MKVTNTFAIDYQPGPDKDYELYIEGDDQFLQLTVYDISQNLFTGVKQFVAEAGDTENNLLTQLLNDEILKNGNFQKVTFSNTSFRAMLVPQTLFDAEHLEDFLKFHHKIDNNEKILYHYISPAEAFLIFTCPLSTENLLKKTFPNVNIKHHAIPFIQLSINKTTDSHLPVVHIFLGQNFFDMLVMKQGKILLFNSFYYQKYTDVLYFLVNVVNLFSIPPHHSHMFVGGNIDHTQYIGIVNELKTIFPFISEELLPDNLSYAQEISALPAHQIQTLVGLKLCE